nr:pheromone receptor OR6 [Mythimna separata]
MQRLKKKLFDDDSLVDNAIKVTEFRYMKIMRYNLNVANGWPGYEIGEGHSNYKNLRSVARIILNQFTFIAGLVYLKLHLDDSFFELGHMIITTLMGFVAFTRILFTLPQSTKYINLATTFLTKIHLLFFKNYSDYAMETHRKVHYISHVFSLCVTIQMFAGIVLFNCIPMWNNFSSGKYKAKILYNSTYEHSLYLSMPVLQTYTHFNAYVVNCIYNWLMSYLCSVSFCMLDLFLSLMVFNVWGHFKILLHDLATFPLPAKNMSSNNYGNPSVNAEMYSEEESKQIFEKLKQCIDYHRFITDFTNKMSEAFGPILLVSYTFYQVSGCLLLLECSQMTTKALMRYLPLTIVVFQQLIVVSVIFELIGSTSEKLKDAVYGLPWQYMDTSNRKIVSIFLYNVQEPIHVKALGVVNVGVTTMATILKTSLSYFTFLRSK